MTRKASILWISPVLRPRLSPVLKPRPVPPHPVYCSSCNQRPPPHPSPALPRASSSSPEPPSIARDLDRLAEDLVATCATHGLPPPTISLPSLVTLRQYNPTLANRIEAVRGRNGYRRLARHIGAPPLPAPTPRRARVVRPPPAHGVHGAHAAPAAPAVDEAVVAPPLPTSVRAQWADPAVLRAALRPYQPHPCVLPVIAGLRADLRAAVRRHGGSVQVSAHLRLLPHAEWDAMCKYAAFLAGLVEVVYVPTPLPPPTCADGAAVAPVAHGWNPADVSAVAEVDGGHSTPRRSRPRRAAGTPPSCRRRGRARPTEPAVEVAEIVEAWGGRPGLPPLRRRVEVEARGCVPFPSSRALKCAELYGRVQRYGGRGGLTARLGFARARNGVFMGPFSVSFAAELVAYATEVGVWTAEGLVGMPSIARMEADGRFYLAELCERFGGTVEVGRRVGLVPGDTYFVEVDGEADLE